MQRRSYSSIYKIYRRLKFVRHKKKVFERNRLEIKRKETQERKEVRIQQREYKIAEQQRQRIKFRADLEQSGKLKRELREEFRKSNNQAKQEWEKLAVNDRIKAKKAHKEERIQRKRQYRRYVRDQFRNFFYSFRALNIRTIKIKIKEFRADAPKRRLLTLISFNSTVLFLLSYFSLFLFAQAVTVVSAGFFDYPVTVHYYEIYFNISLEAWYQDSVKTIFSSGPLVNFAIGITFLIIYSNIRESTAPFKLFFLWGFLHAVNMLFGAMLIGTLFETGVGHVISWMYIMDTGKVLYSIVSIFLLVIAGIITTKQFLISGNTYYNEINKTNRTSFIVSQVLMPYLTGNVFLIILRQPRFIFYDTFIMVTMIICILPIIATYKSYNELYFEEEEKKPALVWISLIMLALVVLFFRGVLEIGLRFNG